MFAKLKKWFKKYFIPHDDNEHKPHFLRWKTVLVILSIVLASELFFLLQVTFILPRSLFLAEILSSILSLETDKARAENSIQPVKIKPLLSKAAQLKADDMAKNGYFAHTSPEGITSWDWLKKVGYKYSYAGENLAINFFESKEVVDAWMKSPAHRENILNKKFTELGIGIANGIYNGRQAVFVVQMFGKPLEENNVSVATVQPITSARQPLANQKANDKEVKGVSIQNTLALAEFATSPKMVSNFFFAALLMITAISLLLTIVVKIKVQRLSPIISGVLLIIIIGFVILFNKYFLFYATNLI